MFKRERLFDFYKIAVAFVGGLAFLIAATNPDTEIFNWRFAGLVFFTIVVTSRMGITLPRLNLFLSFSDSMIFLTFLLYGGKAAIIVAIVESIFTCIFAKYNGIKFSRFSIAFNIGATVLSTSFAYGVWYLLAGIFKLDPTHSDIASLISTLGILALSQFLAASVFTAIFYALKNNSTPWQLWKNECYSISLMQIVSAGLAGIAYKLISLENVLAITITSIVFIVVYFTYRRANKELTSSMENTEQAERDKAEVERLRAEQAEKHIVALNIQLSVEEKLSEALQQSKDAFEYAALHDALTDLYNRSYLIERLKYLFEIEIQKSSKYFILFLDLSRFKNINDSLGHNVGDKVLKLVANRLLRTVNLEDTVARIGGDEFAIILNDLSSVEEAESHAARIFQKLSSPFSVQGNRIFTKPHIGIAPLDANYKTPEEILRDADIAMHYAKDMETDMAVFNTEIRDRFLGKVRLESDLRFALERREFSMHYQPLISLEDGLIIGFEALLRWQHPRRGSVSPTEFIPIAEDSGLIIPITEWILRETTEQLAAWQKIAPNYNDLIISVNISGKHLAQDGLVEEVKKVLKSSKIQPSCLKLEITESVAMENAERTIVILSELKEIGVQLSIDDFGTGYSSLSYLHRLPFDTLKIDRSFVGTVGDHGENSEIIETIISLAKNLKMRAIAEGIETESQLSILRNLNCDYAQGYLFSKPLPKEEMETQLYQRHIWFPQSFAVEDFAAANSENESRAERGLLVF